MDERRLDVAAHHAREREMQHLGFLRTAFGNETLRLAADRGKLHKDPERHDQREADHHGRVDDARAEAEHAVGRKARRGRGPRRERLGGRIEPIAHRLVLQNGGVLLIEAIHPVDHALHVTGKACQHIGELFGYAGCRREHDAQKNAEHHGRPRIRKSGSEDARNAEALELAHGPAKAQDDDHRPRQNGHGHGEHIEHEAQDVEYHGRADEHPYLIKMTARIVGTVRACVFRLGIAIFLQGITPPWKRT